MEDDLISFLVCIGVIAACIVFVIVYTHYSDEKTNELRKQQQEAVSKYHCDPLVTNKDGWVTLWKNC